VQDYVAGLDVAVYFIVLVHVVDGLEHVFENGGNLVLATLGKVLEGGLPSLHDVQNGAFGTVLHDEPEFVVK